MLTVLPKTPSLQLQNHKPKHGVFYFQIYYIHNIWLIRGLFRLKIGREYGKKDKMKIGSIKTAEEYLYHTGIISSSN
jgi:hypothetical protein